MDISSKPRLRFAPSPTGYLHVGGARTALYNYLLAKQTGGTFVLRIEDTDLERSTPESIEAILEGMTWLGLNWDEGPYFQTKRFDLYKEYIQKLLDTNKAYPCFCTPEDLDAKRQKAQAEKQKPMYDRTCFHLTEAEVKAKKEAGLKYCIRFKSVNEGETVVHDIIKGDVTVANKEMDDLVIARTDGSPTYNFTVVVDDVTMNITHVIRGDDHLNNTPRQLQMYEALGFPIPKFAHVPMILGADKKRLSKRHGATSVMAYREMGYLPHALLNYLVRLGWSYQDQEVFTPEELIQKFSLESVSGSAGVFNPEKLLWLNGLYIREAKAEDLLSEMEYQLGLKGINNLDKTLLLQTIKASQEKVKTLVEMAELIDFFFVEITPDPALLEKTFTPDAKKALALVADSLKTLTDWTHDGIHVLFEGLMTQTGLGLGKLASPVRVALSGKKISPGVYDMIRILGRDECLKRIAKYV